MAYPYDDMFGGGYGNPAKNPYFNERSTSHIPEAPRNLPANTQLSGIDAASIYGKNSPAAQVDYSPKGVDAVSGASKYGGAAITAVGMGLDAASMASQRFNFGNVAQSQTDSNSAPVYTAGQLYNQVSGSHPKGAQAGEIGSGALQGAQAGLAFGPVGAAAGAVIGAGIKIVGGAIRKNQQQTEKEHAMTRVNAAQNLYNQQDEDYRQRQNQLYNYYNQNNAAGREYNVYRTQFA